jgi:hypothetical protein
MKLRTLWILLLTGGLALTMGGLTGCSSLKKKPKIVKPSKHDMADQSEDTSFRAFQSRLRKAVSKHDTQMLSSMMVPNFGYSWENGGEGPGVFDYWDRNNLWPELELVLKEKFVPSGNFMVAPADVTFNPDYKGYRAGLQLVNGGWRFAYFVSAPPDTAAGQ